MIDERIEQMVLAGKIMIDAHRLDAERHAELPQRKCRQTIAGDQRERGFHDSRA